MTEDTPCPKCKEVGLWRESADVGVGIIYGPYGCPYCGWSENDSYNLSTGSKTSDDGSPVDQWGGVYPGLKKQKPDEWANEWPDMFTGFPED